jgi:hypothetical protein
MDNIFNILSTVVGGCIIFMVSIYLVIILKKSLREYFWIGRDPSEVKKTKEKMLEDLKAKLPEPEDKNYKESAVPKTVRTPQNILSFVQILITVWMVEKIKNKKKKNILFYCKDEKVIFICLCKDEQRSCIYLFVFVRG